MNVAITADLSASDFEIGRVVEAVDGVEVDLKMVAPLGDRLMPFLRVRDDDHDHESFAERLEELSAVASVVTIEQSDGEGTYAVEWAEEPNPFCRALCDHVGTIRRAVRDEDRWEFDLLFLSEEAFTAFRRELDESGVDLEISRINRTDGAEDEEGGELSDTQRETLDLALAEGYYSIPRRTTTAELGEELGISDQAVIERLRRAITKLAEAYIEAGSHRSISEWVGRSR